METSELNLNDERYPQRRFWIFKHKPGVEGGADFWRFMDAAYKQNGVDGHEIAALSVNMLDVTDCREITSTIAGMIHTLVREMDGKIEGVVRQLTPAQIKELVGFKDVHGKNLLWYLTYRDDQQAYGGFAAPINEKILIGVGVDPNERNDLGLCWADVRRHVNRT